MLVPCIKMYIDSSKNSSEIAVLRAPCFSGFNIIILKNPFVERSTPERCLSLSLKAWECDKVYIVISFSGGNNTISTAYECEWGEKMKWKRKLVLLRVSSVLMLLAALPMLVWCLNLINSATLDYDYAGAGCFGAALVYAFSLVMAIAGLTFAGRPYRYGWGRILAYIQLASGAILIFPLRSYGALTLPPLFVLTILYLFGAGWRNNHLFLTDSNIDENLPVTYQVVPQINFCSKCGNSVIPGDRFCSKCGNRI